MSSFFSSQSEEKKEVVEDAALISTGLGGIYVSEKIAHKQAEEIKKNTTDKLDDGFIKKQSDVAIESSVGDSTKLLKMGGNNNLAFEYIFIFIILIIYFLFYPFICLSSFFFASSQSSEGRRKKKVLY